MSEGWTVGVGSLRAGAALRPLSSLRVLLGATTGPKEWRALTRKLCFGNGAWRAVEAAMEPCVLRVGGGGGLEEELWLVAGSQACWGAEASRVIWCVACGG